MTEQSSSRKSKACDNCRIRRVKCSGDWPCKPCINLGLQSDCKVRVKARPKRALAKGIAPREAEMEGEESVGLDIIKAIEDRTRVWIRDRGGEIDLSLPDIPIPLPISPPMLEPDEEADCFEEFLNLKRYIPFLNQSRVADLHANWQRDKGLSSDQKALVFTAIAFGAFMRWRQSTDTTLKLLWSTYHLMATYELDMCTTPSIYALESLIALFMLSHYAAGPSASREILRKATWQVMELGLNKPKSTPDLDSRSDRYFWIVLYLDSWFSSLSHIPPHLRSDSSATEVMDKTTDVMTLAHFEQFTLVENEIVTYINTRGRPSPAALDLWEGRLRSWQRQTKDGPPFTDTRTLFGAIRSGWLSILLRYPFIDHPTLGISSLGMIARGLSKIVYSYKDLFEKTWFTPKWAESRRLCTAAQLLVLCVEEREITRSEGQQQAQLLLTIFEKMSRDSASFTPQYESVKALLSLADLLELESPVDDPTPLNDQDLAFSLPVNGDLWLEALHFDYS